MGVGQEATDLLLLQRQRIVVMMSKPCVPPGTEIIRLRLSQKINGCHHCTRASKNINDDVVLATCEECGMCNILWKCIFINQSPLPFVCALWKRPSVQALGQVKVIS